MIGAIAGDYIGSKNEFNPINRADFPSWVEGMTFSDDTVLTLAVAEAILKKRGYGETIREFYHRHPKRRHGSRFKQWVNSWDNAPSDSFGNGSAMRVAPIGWAFVRLERVLEEAEKSATPTHNSPQGITGAKAVAASVYMARTGKSKNTIKTYVESAFGYDLSIPYEALRRLGEEYDFEPTCEKTVPPALICFLDSTDYEDAVRKAVSLGWDSDTMACITGGIAEAYYGGIPVEIEEHALSLLPPDLMTVVEDFRKQYYGYDGRGAGVCQLCGTFQLINCIPVAYACSATGGFVCTNCVRLLGDGNSNKGRRVAKETLKVQTHRFCSICRRQFDKQPKEEKVVPDVCEKCLRSIPDTLAVSDYLNRLYRLRHRQHIQGFLRSIEKERNMDYPI